MANIRTVFVDSPEKMPNQNSLYSIIIPQVRDTVPLSGKKKERRRLILTLNRKNENLLPKLGLPAGSPYFQNIEFKLECECEKFIDYIYGSDYSGVPLHQG